MGVRSIEWPTVLVAAAIGGGLTAVLASHEHLPAVVVLTALAVLAAWYNSLQHEVVHGHPTPWPWFNTALALSPLGLVVPFGTYRAVHLAHHRTARLTEPGIDPESFYVSPAEWQRAGRARRALLVALQTLAGRVVLGPVVIATRSWRHEIGSMRTCRGAARVAGHVFGVVAVLAVVTAAGMPVWLYVLGVAWGGGSLSLLRSFVEHRPELAGTRSAVVRSNWFLSLLFLNNNLHHTHHARPRVAWYDLPRTHEQLGSDAIAARGAGLYRGYTEIVRRFLLRPVDHPAIDTPAG